MRMVWRSLCMWLTWYNLPFPAAYSTDREQTRTGISCPRFAHNSGISHARVYIMCKYTHSFRHIHTYSLNKGTYLYKIWPLFEHIWTWYHNPGKRPRNLSFLSPVRGRSPIPNTLKSDPWFPVSFPSRTAIEFVVTTKKRVLCRRLTFPLVQRQKETEQPVEGASLLG